MIRVTDTGTIWPYSLGQLRADEPSRSFSSSPSDAELAEYGVHRVQATAAPEHDPAVEKLVEVQPIEVDGTWQQAWQLVELTPEEVEAYYRATHPPRWLEFGEAVQALPEINAMLGAALGAAPALAMALSVGLGKAADGDSRVFLAAWQAGRSEGLIDADLVAQIQILATTYDLPAAFVGGLG